MKPADSLSGLSEHLSVRGLSRRFGGFTALDGVSLSIRKGEFVCLLGPSGCGKTTLLRLIAGLDQPDAGSVHLLERDITREPPARRDYGIVFQSYALFPNLNVADNIAYGLKPRGGGARHARRVRELLTWWACPAPRTNIRPSCPAASSSGWRWRARWPPRPACCCWTNRCPPWTRGCATSCATNSRACKTPGCHHLDGDP